MSLEKKIDDLTQRIEFLEAAYQEANGQLAHLKQGAYMHGLDEHYDDPEDVPPAPFDADTYFSDLDTATPSKVEQQSGTLASTNDITEEPEEEVQGMTLWQHLEELRWVIFKSLIMIIIGVTVALVANSYIYDLLMFPIKKLLETDVVRLNYEGPITAFIVQLKMAFLGGVTLALPFICYFIWSFISPGLKDSEKKPVKMAIGSGLLFFLIGATFGYFFLKLGIETLLGFGDENIENIWLLSVYIGFCFKLILGFGIIFELPVILGLLASLNVVSSQFLKKNRSYAIVIILILGAMLTPPDPISQMAVAIPMFGLYEVSIWVARYQERKRLKKEQAFEMQP